MRILEVVIDGFKSYPKETILSGFDSHFNAITGLNGSGKSNILDAIWFVLGITSVNHLRASKLQELVYKQGHSGVTQAEVTIVFDNKNKDKSPPTLLSWDAVTVRRVVCDGSSKYYINGKVETQDKVKTLFTSIQLNINNPQFLVLQGRISKIIQTSPTDLLSLLVEAAGLSLFDIKKAEALKRIQKKQAKVDEIQSLIEKDIGPKFERLQKEQADYIRYIEIEGWINQMGREIKIQEYLYSRDRKSKLQILVDNEVVRVEGLEKKIAEVKDKLKTEIKKLKEIKAGGLADLKKESDTVAQEAQQIEKEFVEVKSIINRKEKHIKEWSKAIKKYTKFIETLDQNVFKAKNERKELKELKKMVKKDWHMKKELLRKAQDNLQKIEEGKAVSIVDLLDHQSKELMKKDDLIESEINKNVTSITFFEKEIEDKNVKIKEFDAIRDKAITKIAELNNKIDEKRKVLDNLPNKRRREKDLREMIEDSKKRIQRNTQIIDDLSWNPALTATKRLLTLPGVVGYVMDMFSVKEDRYIKALETIAGSRLTNIITVDVDSAQSVIKEAKNSTARVFVYPNNEMVSRPISGDVRKKLADNFGTEAVVATDAISFNKDIVGRSMEFLFGNTVIWRDSKIAKEVAFSKDYGFNSVTIEGDQFQPSGVLRGGYTKSKASLLKKAQDIAIKKKEEYTLKEELNKYTDELKLWMSENKVRDQHENELELITHERNILKDQLTSEDSIKRLKRELNEVTDTKVICEGKIENLRKMKVENESEIERIKQEIEITKTSDNTKDAFENQIIKLKDEVDKIKQKKKSLQKDIDMTDFKEEANIKQKKESERDLEKEKAEWDKLKAEREKLETQMNELKDKKEKFRDKISKINEKQKNLNKVITESAQNQKDEGGKKEKYMKELEDRREHIAKGNKQLYDLDAVLSKLLQEAPWLKEDWEKTNHRRINEVRIEEMKFEHKKLLEEMNSLKRKVNPDVNELVNQTEADLEKLHTRKQIIEQDKVTIEETIHKLEVKKKEAIQKAYGITNDHIQSIYSTLLPGAHARIDMVNKANLDEGIELKVKFSSGEDASLNELSGGQRSLLALSFILSMLKLKPAPFYILDEIDAALDTSHTNNIGSMIKSHFEESQFIIISLKPEMFKQANVRYEVSFKEGISQVERVWTKQ